MQVSPLRAFRLASICAGSLPLSGCLLQLITGGIVSGEVHDTVVIDGLTILRNCFVVPDGGGGENVTCAYDLLDSNGNRHSLTGTVNVVTEVGGLAGAIVDPLILQVPGNATSFGGTYDDGVGTTGDLVVRSGFKSIPADGTHTLLAEPGQQLVILELPPGLPTDEVEYRFQLLFERPHSMAPLAVKPMFTLRFEAAPIAWFAPLLPCETRFSSIPPIIVPVGDTSQPLTVPAEQVSACDGAEYGFAGFEGLYCDIDVDGDVDRNDLNIIIGARNAPALPGDRLDADENGVINLNDARVCVRRCTRAHCAI
jgi:hypothetical protein